jgi:beta-mannosidase
MISRREFLLASSLVPLLNIAESQVIPNPRSETALNGADWKLGSFTPGGGESRQVFSPAFDDNGFRVVQVPGEVQVQLGFQGMDLYKQSKELTLINQREWWYRKRFAVPSSNSAKLTRLIFDGVDYFAAIWLNGKKLGEHEGGFQRFSFDVSSLLNYARANVLAVRVTCPWLAPGRAFEEYVKGELTMNTVSFGGTSSSLGEGVRFPFTPYVLGPHWGTPAGGNAVFALGLWRDVRLVSLDLVEITDLFVATNSLNADGSATLKVSGTISNHLEEGVSIGVKLRMTPENFSGEGIALPLQQMHLHPGPNDFTLEAMVKEPQLWWTWDLGTPHLYRITAELSSGAGGKIAREIVFGIRTISRADDLSYWLNGKRLFLKGAWYWQAEWFGSLATRETYERDLETYRACNLNHLVAFCYLEKPDFYDLCDQLGMLTFFEFPFSQLGPIEVLSASYPRRQAYLTTSLGQVRDIVVQLRNHPSIVVWAALAEAQMENKGWGVGGESFDQQGYEELSQGIGKLVSELAPGTIYHPSLCDLGEQHFWMASPGPSFGSGNYTEHFNAAAKFVSEYGGMALPDSSSLSKMLRPGEMWTGDADRVPRWSLPVDVTAYAYICEYEYEGLAGNLSRIQSVDRHIESAEELAEASQLYQAFLIQYATEAYRRKKYHPINGTRIWCYGDPYPCISWSFVDYYRVPKIAYYALKRAHARLAISFAYEEALESQVAGKVLAIPVWIVNDYPRDIPLDLDCEIMDISGHNLWSGHFAFNAGTDGAKQVATIEWTTPGQPGVYVLRGRAVERGGDLVATAQIPVKVSPNLFPASLRVLVIGQKRYVAPIFEMISATGATVALIQEESINELRRLRNAEYIRKNYDIVWLAPFDSIWKLIDTEIAAGLKEAIKGGVGFIHTGGAASYHGGDGMGACLHFSGLDDALPVAVLDRNDLVLGAPDRPSGPMGEVTFSPIRDIASGLHATPHWQELRTKNRGVHGFNEVRLKPGSLEYLSALGRPLVAAGRYGEGRTVAFTGFTPAYVQPKPRFPGAGLPHYLFDEQLRDDPATEFYFELFAMLLAEASGRAPAVECGATLASRREPLFEILKKLPPATLSVTETIRVQTSGKGHRLSLTLLNGKHYARLIRVRAEWDKSERSLVLYSDNYFDLLPGESKSLHVDFYSNRDMPKGQTARGRLMIQGTNVKRMEVQFVAPG